MNLSAVICSFLPFIAQSIPGPNWSTLNTDVLYGGNKFELKGINWFGMETSSGRLEGLDHRPLVEYLDFLQENRFNAIRVPLCVQSILDNSVDWMSLDALFHESEMRGIHILLDQHTMERDHISELWYTDTISESNYTHSIYIILGRYGDAPNLMGIDLKNEPHGAATWGSYDSATDWGMAVGRIISDIEYRFAGGRWLYFVAGVQGPVNWGGDISGVLARPLQVPAAALSRLVLSPHVYGPSVLHSSATHAIQWQASFGSVIDAGHAVIVGEWGGWYISDDIQWHEDFVGYMRGKGVTSNFYWCLNPTSGDTGGILEDDWKTPVQDKLDMIGRMQPEPTVTSFPA
jgi:endoglucanase